MKFPSSLFKHLNQSPVLWGIMLIAVLVMAAAVVTKSNQSGNLPLLQQNTPTPNSLTYLPPISITPQVSSITDWQIYTDNVAGFSFQYPRDWREAGRASKGYSVSILPSYPTRYRSISIDLAKIDHTIQAASANALNSMALQRVRDEHGEYGVDQIKVRTVTIDKVQAAELSRFPYIIGFHTQVVFTHGGYLYTVTLEEGGQHEGFPDYDDPLAQQDLQLMYQILNTLEFSK